VKAKHDRSAKDWWLAGHLLPPIPSIISLFALVSIVPPYFPCSWAGAWVVPWRGEAPAMSPCLLPIGAAPRHQLVQRLSHRRCWLYQVSARALQPTKLARPTPPVSQWPWHCSSSLARGGWAGHRHSGEPGLHGRALLRGKS
jgi:hypothetical protein